MAAIDTFVNSHNGDETRRMIAMYLAAVTEVDLAIGRILIELERLGLHHDTLVIYTSVRHAECLNLKTQPYLTLPVFVEFELRCLPLYNLCNIYTRWKISVLMQDHGDMLGSHGKVDKTPWFYDESLHVPLIMRHPRFIAPRSVIAQPVSTVDIAPTILDFVLRPEEYEEGTHDKEEASGDDDGPVLSVSKSKLNTILAAMEGSSLRPVLQQLVTTDNQENGCKLLTILTEEYIQWERLL